MKSESQLADELLDRVREISRRKGLPSIEINQQTDLFAAGILDSMELVELLMILDARSGSGLDFSEIGPEQLSNIKGLCELAVQLPEEKAGTHS